MALSPAEQMAVDQLKRMLGGALGDYTDDQLAAMIAAGTSLNGIAAQVWGEYAAKTATLVDMAEGNSRRQLGDLYDQGLKMSIYFNGLAAAENPITSGRSTTRAIVRPGRA